MLKQFFKLAQLHHTILVFIELCDEFKNFLLLSLLEMVPLTQYFLDESELWDEELVRLLMQVVQVYTLAELTLINITALVFIKQVCKRSSLIFREEDSQNASNTN